MIPEFSTIIQEDIVVVVNHFRGKKISEDKLSLAALRILFSVNMAVGVTFGVCALTMIPASPITGLFILALSIAWYAFNHDLFCMAKNATDKSEHAKEVGIKAFISNLVNQFFYGGEGPVGEDEIVTLTENTFFKPIWNAIRIAMTEDAIY